MTKIPTIPMISVKEAQKRYDDIAKPAHTLRWAAIAKANQAFRDTTSKSYDVLRAAEQREEEETKNA